MKFYTFDEFKEIAKNQDYKHVGLKSYNGQWVVPINQPGKPIDERLEKINHKIESGLLPDGVYWFIGKNHNRKEAHEDKFGFEKGDTRLSDEDREEIDKYKEERTSKSVLSYDSAIEMKEQLAEQKYKIEHLEKELARVEGEKEELEQEIIRLESEQDEKLADGQASSEYKFFDGLSKMMVPILEKHMELKEKKMALQEKFLSQQVKQRKTQTDPMKAKLAEFVTMKSKSNPAEYEILVQTQSGCKDINEWSDILSAQHPDLYNQIVDYVSK